MAFLLPLHLSALRSAAWKGNSAAREIRSANSTSRPFLATVVATAIARPCASQGTCLRLPYKPSVSLSCFPLPSPGLLPGAYLCRGRGCPRRRRQCGGRSSQSGRGRATRFSACPEQARGAWPVDYPLTDLDLPVFFIAAQTHGASRTGIRYSAAPQDAALLRASPSHTQGGQERQEVTTWQ